MRRNTKIQKDVKKYKLRGQRFGDLVVLRRSRTDRPGAWIAQCDCGKLTLVYDYLLKEGKTKTCGCAEVP